MTGTSLKKINDFLHKNIVDKIKKPKSAPIIIPDGKLEETENQKSATDSIILEVYSKVKKPDPSHEDVDRFADVHVYIAQARKQNLGKQFENSKNPAEILWHAVLSNNVPHLDSSKLLEAYNEVLLDNTKLFDFKKNPDIDPDQILEIIKLILEAILLIMKYLDAAGLCKKKQDTEKLNEALNQFKNTNDNPFLNLANGKLENLKINNVNLHDIDIAHGRIKNVSMEDGDLHHGNLSYVKTKSNVNFKNTNLTGTNLDWSDISSATVNAEKFKHFDFKTYLKTLYPESVKYDGPIPTIGELNTVLGEFVLELSKAKSDSEADLAERMHAHHIVATNINRIVTSMIQDSPDKAASYQDGHDLLKAAIAHPFFSDHCSAKFMAGLNKIPTFFHDLVHRDHKKDFPYVGNYSQNILIELLNVIEPQLPKHTNTIRP